MPAVKIFIAGLCSLLNLDHHDVTLPEPSVILVRSGPMYGHSAQHIPFLAWDGDSVTANVSAGTITDVPLATQYKYVTLDGERIEIKGDTTADPDLTQFHGVASYYQYSRKPVLTSWDDCYIPAATKNPRSQCVAGFMRFGAGTLEDAKPTPFDVEFRDTQGATTVASTLPREVIYTIDVKEYVNNDYASVTIYLRKFADEGNMRTITLTSKNKGDDIQVFIGNYTKSRIHYVCEQWSTEEDPPKNPAGQHFYALHSEVRFNQDGPIPYRLDVWNKMSSEQQKQNQKNTTTPSAHPHGGPIGGDTGYCGPDGKP